MAVPKRKTPRAKTRSRRASRTGAGRAGPLALPELRRREAAAHRVRQLRLVPRPPGHRRRLAHDGHASASPSRSTRWAATTPRARSSRGALDAVAELDVDVLLVGRRGRDRAAAPRRRASRGVERRRTPPRSSRWTTTRPPRCARKKDSSLVRTRRRPCATARPTPWSAPGNTGATMAAALLRMGRIRASPGPRSRCRSPCPAAHPPAARRRRRDRRLHARVARPVRAHGPRVRPRPPRRSTSPRSACSRTARRPGKGDELRKRTFALLAKVPGFIGNVEGRDLMHGTRRRHRHRRLHRQRRAQDARGRARAPPSSSCSRVLDSTPEAQEAGKVVAARCCSRRPRRSTPTSTGGAVLLGVDGVCVISHGSSIGARDRQRGAGRDGVRARPAWSSGCKEAMPMPAETHVERRPDRPRRGARASSASGWPRSSRSTRTASRSTRASPTTSTPTRSRSSSSSRRSRRSSASARSGSPSTTRTSPICAPCATRSTTSSPGSGVSGAHRTSSEERSDARSRGLDAVARVQVPRPRAARSGARAPVVLRRAPGRRCRTSGSSSSATPCSGSSSPTTSYAEYPDLPEGELAKLRASVVNAEVLAEVAREVELGASLLLGKGEDASGGRDEAVDPRRRDGGRDRRGLPRRRAGTPRASSCCGSSRRASARARPVPAGDDYKTRLQELAAQTVRPAAPLPGAPRRPRPLEALLRHGDAARRAVRRRARAARRSRPSRRRHASPGVPREIADRARCARGTTGPRVRPEEDDAGAA